MNGLLKISRGIDWLSEKIGILATLSVMIACFVSAGNASLRYVSNAMTDHVREWLVSSGFLGNAPLELQWYMFAAMVMLGGAVTLCKNEHVRVDLLYGNVSESTRNWIDLFGCLLFLIPMCVLMIYVTVPFFLESYKFNETSSNAGGLIRWPVKILLPIGFGLLLLQAISELIKTIAAMLGYVKQGSAYERPLQ